MNFDLQAMFASLAEKEKLKGHHSPEGQAIRILGRALNGWLSATLSGRDVLGLAHQAVEDWLKSKLRISSWSRRDLPDLIVAALTNGLLTPAEAARLWEIHDARVHDEQHASAGDISDILEFCIGLVEKRW
jgi:hypothetical protein